MTISIECVLKLKDNLHFMIPRIVKNGMFKKKKMKQREFKK